MLAWIGLQDTNIEQTETSHIQAEGESSKEKVFNISFDTPEFTTTL